MAVIITGTVRDFHTRILRDKFKLNNVVVGRVTILRGLGFKFTQGFLDQLKVSAPLQKLFEQDRIINAAKTAIQLADLNTLNKRVDFGAPITEILNKDLKVPFVVMDKTFALRSETELKLGDNPNENEFGQAIDK
jgi:hypothetical protein